MELWILIGGNVSGDLSAPFFRILLTELKGLTFQQNIILSLIDLGLAFSIAVKNERYSFAGLYFTFF
jgi:hypothetical protein